MYSRGSSTTQQPIVIYDGHKEEVSAVGFSPDGKSVISGSYDRTIRIWDSKSPQSKGQPLRGHSGQIYSISVSPLGNILASGSADHTVRLWNIDAGLPNLVGEPLEGHQKAINSVAFSPRNNLVVSGSSDNTLRLWDTRGKRSFTPFKGHHDWVKSVAFSYHDNTIVSGSLDGTIRLWDVEQGRNVLAMFNESNKAIYSTQFSPEGSLLASGSTNKLLQIWDIRSGKMVLRPFKGHTNCVASVAFCPSGNYVASGSWDRSVRVWDLRQEAALITLPQMHGGLVNSVAWSPSGECIASGSYDCTILVQNIGGLESGFDHSANTIGILSQRSASDATVEKVVGSSSPTLYRTISDTKNQSSQPGGSENDTVTIGRHMTIQEMFDRLMAHGCVDLTSRMKTDKGLELVSRGGFGDIWMGRLEDGTKVAVKSLRARMVEQCDYKSLKHATREIHVWSLLNHENIHKLMGIILLKDVYLGMVSEWMENGNIHEYSRANPGFDRYKMSIHVVSGLAYMHQENVIHGDLKALNVLVSSEGSAKLTDFGLSVTSEGSLAFSHTKDSAAGSTRWMAPERLEADDAPASKESDVYALGMTILEIFTGKVPYPECTDVQVMGMIVDGRVPSRLMANFPDTPNGNQIWEQLLNCWNYNPSARPAAMKVLEKIKIISEMSDS
ncbi:Tyrosine kinase family catalytic domain protein [Rhizoctonia solani]|uniref:Tyrosine kinase family catalytic domain protein n=1 Tax=Rhizoctonia solani TaxID=456999 RepID=A0A8H8SY02_9AGAM|nr:Tyrosine kinase family catalytic domain protein [Rhizoctonia solani]QRW22044.1 Tyrosine kinase family catalytic domain protein [Rhizoctonia solani]